MILYRYFVSNFIDFVLSIMQFDTLIYCVLAIIANCTYKKEYTKHVNATRMDSL